MVKDRIAFFNEIYGKGSIETKIISDLSSANIVVKAIVVPDIEMPTRRFVAHSQATVGEGMVNTTAALENAETSAVGRALALMGIGVVDSVASADEVKKAINQTSKINAQSGEENQDKCEICGASKGTHSPTCINNPKNKYE